MVLIKYFINIIVLWNYKKPIRYLNILQNKKIVKRDESNWFGLVYDRESRALKGSDGSQLNLSHLVISLLFLRVGDTLRILIKIHLWATRVDLKNIEMNF